MSWAGVIGRPEDFTLEWAYTALSRAREQTTLHIIAEPSPQVHEREQYAPVEGQRAATEALAALQRAMNRSEAERLALDQEVNHGLAEALIRRTPPLKGVKPGSASPRPRSPSLSPWSPSGPTPGRPFAPDGPQRGLRLGP